MDIAGLSTSLAQVNTVNQVSVAMLSKSLDTSEQQGASLISMMDRSMELSVNPNVGSNFDMSV
ncbi:MAG: YjfB family protein [Lachnospiraceae bacterium]|nr:YjfB family protein [Lachnospiraceae bacterium]